MAWLHVADVQGSGRKPYAVALQTEGDRRGTLGCSCPDWTRGKSRREREALALVSAPEYTRRMAAALRAAEGSRAVGDCKHITGVRSALCSVLRGHAEAGPGQRHWLTARDDARRILFKADAGDLFRCLIEHGCDGFELEEFTKMAVIADAAPGLVLPVLSWRMPSKAADR